MNLIENLQEFEESQRLTRVESRPRIQYGGQLKLLVFVLNKEEYLEDVLEAYVEAGVAGATLLDSEGMGRFLAYEVPLFASFKEFMKGNKPYNKTIISVIKQDEVIDRVHQLVDRVVGGIDNPGTGIMFTVPVDWTVGMVPEDEEV